MARQTNDLLSYAVALFTCYGVFVSMGLGRVGWCPVFLLLGLGVALSVIVLDAATDTDVGLSIIGVVLFCTLGFVGGWGGSQVLGWVGGPGALFRAGTR